MPPNAGALFSAGLYECEYRCVQGGRRDSRYVAFVPFNEAHRDAYLSLVSAVHVTCLPTYP